MPERNLMVVASANFETVTNYIHAYTIPVLKNISRIGTKSVVLEGEADTRENFEAMIEEHNPLMVLVLGHGLSDITTGFENQIILDSRNAGVVKNRTIFIFSCLSGKKLAPTLIKENCNALVAFKEEFLFIIDENARSPLSDKLARGNLTAALEVVRVLANGGTYEEAHTAMQEAFDKEIAYWKTQDIPGNSFIISSLMWDKEHAVMLGDESTTVSDPVPAPVVTPLAIAGVGISLGAIAYMLSKRN